MRFPHHVSNQHIGTAEDRAALFDYLLTSIMTRDAFSPPKNKALGIDIDDIKKGVMQYRDDMINAQTDQALFHTLVKMSNARKNIHLRVRPVDQGLHIAPGTDVEVPLRFLVDYGTPDHYCFFVADVAEDIHAYTGALVPGIGDKVLAVNDTPIADYFAMLEPYRRYSNRNNLWWRLAEDLSTKDLHVPSSYYGEHFTCTLQRNNGEAYTLSLPYLQKETITWRGFYTRHGDPRYPGFAQLFSTQTYDLYLHVDGKPILVLDWYGFGKDLMKDVDQLLDYASAHHLLDYAVIFDGTRSRGGSKGAYAVQHLSAQPFKTTFGNVKISDIIEPFIRLKREEYASDTGVSECIDGGAWLLEWLEDDVMKAVQAGQAYSNTVPFKSAHAPKYSDGTLQPAARHFRGPLVCFFGPKGGSHLDQFAAIVVDNHLGYTIGMPCGGYSNTWEWEEILVFPISKQPVVKFMWDIGHTIRPNGQILEGNPAQVDEYIPVTADNYLDYYQILLDRALHYLNTL